MSLNQLISDVEKPWLKIWANEFVGNLTGNVTGGTHSGDIVGNVIGNVKGDVTGDITGNVVGNLTGDMFGNMVGDLIGDVTGNVFGDITGNVFGDVTGNVFGNLTGNVQGRAIIGAPELLLRAPNDNLRLEANGLNHDIITSCSALDLTAINSVSVNSPEFNVSGNTTIQGNLYMDGIIVPSGNLSINSIPVQSNAKSNFLQYNTVTHEISYASESFSVYTVSAGSVTCANRKFFIRDSAVLGAGVNTLIDVDITGAGNNYPIITPIADQPLAFALDGVNFVPPDTLQFGINAWNVSSTPTSDAPEFFVYLI